MQYKRKRGLLCALALCMAAGATAQEQPIALKDLKVPNSPSFTILDYSPSIIDRPGTPKAFTASIINLLTQGNGLPKNLAMEFSPFWLFPNKLDVYRYMGLSRDSAQSSRQQIFANLRNFSISAGAVYRDSSEAHPFNANYVALGLRTNVITIRRRAILQATYRAVDSIAMRMRELLQKDDCLEKFEPGTDEYRNCLKQTIQQKMSSDETLLQRETALQDLMAVRPALQFDLAFANAWSFRDNSYSNSHRYRTGVWGIVSYSQPLANTRDISRLAANKNYLNLHALARYTVEDSTTNHLAFTRGKLLDLGARLELEIDRFSISLESVARLNQTNSGLNTGRHVGILQYRFSDNLFLFGTFGKNFGDRDNVSALLGINLGLGRQQVYERF